jgi:putative heme iron utilization protein
MEAVVDDLADIASEAREFRDQFKSIQLSTATLGGTPTASYAPFVQLQENQFGIYISELAAHTHNLVDNPKASVLFIESEEKTKQLFARQRLAYTCDATLHSRDSDTFLLVIDAMKARFKGIMEHLEKMQDFHVVTLNASHASYVRGFAQAYQFENADLNKIRHINDKGHNEK